jgi:hypothetical protein
MGRGVSLVYWGGKKPILDWNQGGKEVMAAIKIWHVSWWLGVGFGGVGMMRFCLAESRY